MPIVRNVTYNASRQPVRTDFGDEQVTGPLFTGLLSSGNDDPGFTALSPALRPSALYLSTNIREAPATRQVGVDHGGFVTLKYGNDGNVTEMTVRSQCRDRSATLVCADPQTASISTRQATLENNCRCQAEQHYRYDWDELNRLSEARRYDRQAAAGAWRLMVQQRYRYDAGNVRLIKETLNYGNDGASFAATTLHPFPGDYERRGLAHDYVGHTYNASTALGTETQYMVGGARLVWASNEPRDPNNPSLTREQRLTLPLTDLVQSTAAVVDLQSGDLLEHTTFYPNGARETHHTTDEVSMQLEPIGFTGKEADEEVGLVYFGERYLIPRVGRWASADPLSVHAMGGGEAMNGYHYVSGNLLQARDPLGLNSCGANTSCPEGASSEDANFSDESGSETAEPEYVPPGPNSSEPGPKDHLLRPPPETEPSSPRTRTRSTPQAAPVQQPSLDELMRASLPATSSLSEWGGNATGPTRSGQERLRVAGGRQHITDNRGSGWQDRAEGVALFVGGAMDTFSFNLGPTLREHVTDPLFGDHVDEDRDAHSNGSIVGVILSALASGGATSGSLAARMATWSERTRKGIAFSHWIPARYFDRLAMTRIPDSIMRAFRAFELSMLNGNRVSYIFHARTDPKAFQFMYRYLKAMYPMYAPWLRQLLRVPVFYPGAAAGGSAAAASME